MRFVVIFDYFSIFLADEFALFDRYFCSRPGPTWPNRYSNYESDEMRSFIIYCCPI